MSDSDKISETSGFTPDETDGNTAKAKIDSRIDLDNPDFQNAWQLINYTRRSVFLTGKAGTGKSTFLRYIVENIRKKTVVLAPTGIAAVNVSGQTLHSFFKIPLKPILPTDPDFAIRTLRKRMKYSSSHVKLLRQLDLIIIDEISMVRADIIDFIDKILRVYCHNMREPFGGKQLLLVGDIFQLEPVVTGDARDVLAHYYNAPYFFNALAFNELAIVPIELRKVYRQDDADFISLLDRVRAGQPAEADIRRLNAKLIPSEQVDRLSADMTMTIASRRDMVDHINERHLNELKTPEIVYKGIIKGDFPMNALPTDLELSLKVGAQIVFIKNSPDRRWVNGTLGIIDSLSDEKICVRLEQGNVVEVEQEVWGNIKYQYNEEKGTVDEIELGSYMQFPVKLAWALTIHKSQGLTFNKVIIDIGRGAFTGGQTYVALSRCRSFDGISLCSTLNMRDIFVNRHIIDFASRFNNQKLIDEAIESSKADDFYNKSSKAFDMRDFYSAVDYLAQAIESRNELKKPTVRRLIARKLAIISQLEHKIQVLNEKVESDKKRFLELSDTYVTLGNECAEAGEYAPALANYNKALELAPDNYLALLLMAQLVAENGETDKAIALLKEALDINPEDTRALVSIGDIYSAEGDLAAAMDFFLRAHALDEYDKKILRRIISLFENMGDEESAEHYKKLLKRGQRKNKN